MWKLIVCILMISIRMASSSDALFIPMGQLAIAEEQWTLIFHFNLEQIESLYNHTYLYYLGVREFSQEAIWNSTLDVEEISLKAHVKYTLDHVSQRVFIIREKINNLLILNPSFGINRREKRSLLPFVGDIFSSLAGVATVKEIEGHFPFGLKKWF